MMKQRRGAYVQEIEAVPERTEMGDVRRRSFSVLVSLFLVVLLLFKMASLGAAGIFNYAVSKQKMLRGTITVEEITANIHGGVTFTNLAWDDPQEIRSSVCRQGR